MLKITRFTDSRFAKCILNRVADIPGGVTVKTAELGGTALLEGTPLAYLSTDGLYHVCKTAKIVTDATSSATTYDVAKGHHFKVGDYFATEGANGQAITAINKTSSTTKDTITVGTTLGVAITAASATVAFEATGNNKVVKYAPTVVAGSSYDVIGENLFVDAWPIAIVKTGNAPWTNATVTGTMKGVIYVV